MSFADVSSPRRPAVYIYRYAGKPFTHFDKSGNTQLYTSRDLVFGELRLARPLLANLKGLPSIQPLSFRFTDGVHVITHRSRRFDREQVFRFNTDVTGSITEWTVQLHMTDSNGRSYEIETIRDLRAGRSFDIGGVFHRHSASDGRFCCGVREYVDGDATGSCGTWIFAREFPRASGGLISRTMRRFQSRSAAPTQLPF